MVIRKLTYAGKWRGAYHPGRLEAHRSSIRNSQVIENVMLGCRRSEKVESAEVVSKQID